MYKYVEDKQFLSRMRSLCGEIMQDLCHTLKEEYDKLLALVKRKETVLKSIEEQEKLTPELQAAIEKTTKLQEL